MSVLTIIKKIGDKIISVVEWPFVHATMVEKLLSNGCADAPATKAAIVGLVEQFEVIGPDTVADIAAKGFDLAADVKTVNDVKALFSDSTKGLATQMNSYITGVIGTNGALSTRTSDLTQQSTDITTQISNLEAKITNDSNQWDSEFQAMETAQSQTNQELTYLSQGVSNGSL